MYLLLCGGERELHGAALFGLALDGGGASVGFDDGPDEAQAEAEPAFASAASAAKMPVPNARQVFRADADAGVGKPDLHVAVASFRRDVHASAGGCVFDGV